VRREGVVIVGGIASAGQDGIASPAWLNVFKITAVGGIASIEPIDIRGSGETQRWFGLVSQSPHRPCHWRQLNVQGEHRPK
jgi:hypothetical protein